MIIKFVIIAALVRLLIMTDNPWLCSGIYTAIIFILSLISGAALVPALIATAITFVIVSIYFLLLNRFETGSAIWWIIGIGGVVLIFL